LVVHVSLRIHAILGLRAAQAVGTGRIPTIPWTIEPRQLGDRSLTKG
jgi:hypothetical protein